MDATPRMTALEARKQMLVAEADLHRHIIGLEQLRLRERWDSTHRLMDRSRWWLFGGVVLSGWLLGRRGRGFARWLPIIAASWRALKSQSLRDLVSRLP